MAVGIQEMRNGRMECPEAKVMAGGTTNNRKLMDQQSVDQVVKSICGIMRWSNCAGALQ